MTKPNNDNANDFTRNFGQSFWIETPFYYFKKIRDLFQSFREFFLQQKAKLSFCESWIHWKIFLKVESSFARYYRIRMHSKHLISTDNWQYNISISFRLIWENPNFSLCFHDAWFYSSHSFVYYCIWNLFSASHFAELKFQAIKRIRSNPIQSNKKISEKKTCISPNHNEFDSENLQPDWNHAYAIGAYFFGIYVKLHNLCVINSMKLRFLFENCCHITSTYTWAATNKKNLPIFHSSKMYREK